MQSVLTESSLTSRVTETLREAILSGELEPDSLHAVQAVASQIGVSRTPVREALIHLAAQGLVRFEANRGFVVLGSTSQDLQEIFRLRLLLEVPSLYATIERLTSAGAAALEADLDRMRVACNAGDAHTLLVADRNFHKTIMVLSGNSRLAEFVDSLRDFVLTRRVSTVGHSRSGEEILSPHLELMRAIRQGDTATATSLMQSHILSTARLLLAQEFGPDAVDEFDKSLQLPGQRYSIANPDR
jgi:DNA-binding GntR family transcriptional regulator